MARYSLEEAKSDLRRNGYRVRMYGSRYRVLSEDYTTDMYPITGREVVAFAASQFRTVTRTTTRFNGFNQERTFGVEFECFSKGNHITPSQVVEKLRENGIACRDFEGYTHRVSNEWHVTTDSSVGGYNLGIEVVSPILKGDAGLAEVTKVCDILHDQCGLRVDKSCGTHVHIGLGSINTNQLYSLFDNYKNNESLFDSLVPCSRRANNNSFCKALSTRQAWDGSRYFKINKQSFVKYGTIEYRQHSGTLEGNKICHWIKLVSSVTEYVLAKGATTFSSVENMCEALMLDTEYYVERMEDLAC